MKITPRKPRFSIGNTPLHWVKGDVQTTHTVNVLSLLLPSGERWFVRLFRDALPYVKDDALRRDVRGFIGQEANHGAAHDRVIELLTAQGLDVKPYIEDLEWLFNVVLGDSPFGFKIPPPYQEAWLRYRVGAVASIEHFTTMLGAWVLEAEPLADASSSKAMMDLLLWHGAEEVEHRSVAFELFEHMGGSYASRVSSMIIVLSLLTYLWARGVGMMMEQDPKKPGKATWAAFVRAGRKGLLPTPEDIFSAIGRYVRPWHHPKNEPVPESTFDVLERFSFNFAQAS